MPTQSESSSLVTPGQLVKALYDYTADSSDGKVLNVSAGELFLVIKFTKPDEWLYVVSVTGSLGYIPANFVRNHPLNDEELLKLVEGILQRLGPASAGNMVTARQVNHARVKLTQVRCEIAQRIHFDCRSVSTLDDAAGMSLNESVRSEDQGVQTSPSLIEKKKELLSRKEDELGHEERVEEITSNTREQALGPLPPASQTNSDAVHDTAAAMTIISESDQKVTETSDRSNERPDGDEAANEGCTENTIESAHSPIRIHEANHSITHMHSNPLKHDHEISHVDQKDGNQSEMNSQSFEDHDRDVDQTSSHLAPSHADQEDDDDVSDHLAAELIQKVRLCSDMNHELCKKTVSVVVAALAEAIPSWKTKCHQIATRLQKDKLMHMTSQESADWERIQSIFKRLWSCQNDEQQRSWPIHEDESVILSSLQDLTTLLSDADPVVTRDIIAQRNYAHVHSLTEYFQMETRKSIRMQLCAVFMEVIRLNNKVIPDLLLPSVLPNCLAEEMLNYFHDTERWAKSARLFTAIFSTGHKPLNTLHDHVNEKFVSNLINIVERVDEEGNKLDTGIPSESSIPPILSFNLHFDSRATNLVLRALKSRKTATQLTENLVSYFNWSEDPTLVPNILSHAAFTDSRSNAVHKLLTEILDEEDTAKLFYLNDIRVIIDIVIVHLNNLTSGDQERLACLIICEKILRNTSFMEEPQKPEILFKCLDEILENENSTADEKTHADTVKKLFMNHSNKD